MKVANFLGYDVVDIPRDGNIYHVELYPVVRI
jgi:hypothetical protein